MRVSISLSVLALGFVLGSYELFQRHWFAGVGYFVSALITGGLILFGASFVREGWLGASLALVVSVCGFCGFLFENRGLDANLDQARFEAGAALIQLTNVCPGAMSRTQLLDVAKVCFLQPSRDKLIALADGVKQAYLPLQLDFADKVLNTAVEERPDLCKQLLLRTYRECPAAFSSMAPASIKTLQLN